MWTFDHLAVAAETLEDGVAYAEDALGVSLGPGGTHAKMGTYNRLLSLGNREYLEVIAIDPSAPTAAMPRWFGLDEFSGPPRIVSWLCRVSDLSAAVQGRDVGAAHPMERGDYRWSISIRPDGSTPMGGAHPNPLQWQGPHPVDNMSDTGVRLTSLKITTPDAEVLSQLPLDDDRIGFLTGTAVHFRAQIQTPNGVRTLT